MIDREKDIVLRAARGDSDAFSLLVEEYQGPVYRLALRMGLSPSDAEEAAQDAFVSAWRALPNFRGDSKFSTWLYKLTTNAALDILRREKKHLGDQDVTEMELSDEGESMEEAVERQDTVQAVRWAIGQLAPEYREILLLRYLQQLSYEEIQEALRLPKGTVKSRMNRAKAQLKEILLKNGNLFDVMNVQLTGKEERL